MRQLTQKGDPRLCISLPINIKKFLKDSAKLNKRSLQDEFIKRLAASFKHEESARALKRVFSEEVKSAYKGKNSSHS
jgi:hypothetical protein